MLCALLLNKYIQISEQIANNIVHCGLNLCPFPVYNIVRVKIISYETNEVYVDLCETSKGDHTASHLATGSSELKSKHTADLYGHLNLTLMLAVAS